MKKKQPGTGEWFIQSREFAEWKRGRNSFIWLHGIRESRKPTSFKEMLIKDCSWMRENHFVVSTVNTTNTNEFNSTRSSTIIQDVISSYHSEQTMAVAYFYFDFSDPEKQRAEKLIRSLLVQLSAKCLYLPESLQSAYNRSQNGQNQPTIEELSLLLREIIKSFRGTYILLDALDECTERADVLNFIEVLIGWNIDSLHVLSTSRKESDIATSLDPLATCQQSIQSAAVDADIRGHILERLSSDRELRKWPVHVQNEIEHALTKGANGM